MKIVEVENLWQAMLMRSIRNECRDFMTRDRKKIGILDQIRWFWVRYTPARDIGKLYGYLFYDGLQAIGYGLVVVRDNKFWITGGLRQNMRGKGLGTELFRLLVDLWKEEQLFLEVLDTNFAGQKIYRKLCFRKFKQDGNVIFMKRGIKR